MLLSLLFTSLIPTVYSRSIQGRQASVNETRKAGLGWNNHPETDMHQFESTGKVSWYYTWSSWPVDQGRDLDFVPLLWGTNAISDWKSNVGGRLKPMFERGAISAVLAMNEPQERGQSNMSPADAKELWMEYLEPLKTTYPNLRLGSPATSSAPSGKNWTAEWLAVCGTDCSVDFIALHWYGTNATEFIRYINDFHDTFQRPLWITEWACHDFSGRNDQCTVDETDLFMNVTQEYMDGVDWVERYAWFGAFTNINIHDSNALLTEEGYITGLGAQYIGANITDIVASGGGPRYPHFGNAATTRYSSGWIRNVGVMLVAVGLVFSWL